MNCPLHCCKKYSTPVIEVFTVTFWSAKIFRTTIPIPGLILSFDGVLCTRLQALMNCTEIRFASPQLLVDDFASGLKSIAWLEELFIPSEFKELFSKNLLLDFWLINDRPVVWGEERKEWYPSKTLLNRFRRKDYRSQLSRQRGFWNFCKGWQKSF